MNKDKNNNQDPNEMQYMPIFMCIGISIGFAIGAALSNIPIGMCIGMGVGVSLGGALDALNRKKEDNASEQQNTEDENATGK